MIEFLYIIGVVLFGFGLRTFSHPIPRKLGMFTFLGASFLIGFFIADYSWVGGIVALSVWFLLPWLEILTRIRGLRLPTRKSVEVKYPPNRIEFPQIHEVSSEVANEGFTMMDNVGWNDEQSQQFFRIFHRESDHTTAMLCLHEQAGHSIFFVSISTRTEDDELFRTWNYPFSYSMVMPPSQHTHRAPDAQSFGELLDIHHEFLDNHWIDDARIASTDPESLPHELEREIHEQVDHNMKRGIIKPAGDGLFRYSPRGLFFLWTQFVKDMFKLG